MRQTAATLRAPFMRGLLPGVSLDNVERLALALKVTPAALLTPGER